MEELFVDKCSFDLLSVSKFMTFQVFFFKDDVIWELIMISVVIIALLALSFANFLAKRIFGIPMTLVTTHLDFWRVFENLKISCKDL